MGGTSQLRPGDGDAILSLIEDAWRDDPGPALPWALFDGLRALLACGTEAGFQAYQVVEPGWVEEQGCCEDGSRYYSEADEPVSDAEVLAFLELWWRDALCSHPQRSGDLRSVLLSTDFFPTAQGWRNRPIRSLLDPDVTGVMSISLAAPPGTVRRLVLGRTGGRVFTERDRAVGTLLRPHIQEIWLDAHRRRAGVPRLTAREWEVLALTASGLSHAQIADRLVVSVSTVHKHMEHVRERLGASTAAAAAAIALPYSPGESARHRAARSVPHG